MPQPGAAKTQMPMGSFRASGARRGGERELAAAIVPLQRFQSACVPSAIDSSWAKEVGPSLQLGRTGWMLPGSQRTRRSGLKSSIVGVGRRGEQADAGSRRLLPEIERDHLRERAVERGGELVAGDPERTPTVREGERHSDAEPTPSPDGRGSPGQLPAGSDSARPHSARRAVSRGLRPGRSR